MDFQHYFDRIMNVIEELIREIFNTRTLLAGGGLLGFFFIANRVIDNLVDPPASELFAILNLVFGVSMIGLSYWFGVQAGRRQGPPGSGGEPPVI